jgi:hypothetical protein
MLEATANGVVLFSALRNAVGFFAAAEHLMKNPEAVVCFLIVTNSLINQR